LRQHGAWLQAGKYPLQRCAHHHLNAQDGNTEAVRPRMLSRQEYNDCLGLPEVEAWEQRFPG
jgi:hypothetical protein